MTDKEMALDIAEKFVEMRTQISALKGELAWHVDKDTLEPIEWKSRVQETIASPSSRLHVRTFLKSVGESIDNQDEHTSLLHTIHQHIAE